MANKQAASSGRRKNQKSSGRNEKEAETGVAARRMAINALVRIDQKGAYANLLLPELLERSELSDQDRRFVTELVYGTTRMQRACDYLVDRFVLDKVEPVVRAGLRVGAYQLHFLRTPAHAAVAATVGAVPKRTRSIVNAVLRRVADSGPVTFPNRGTELSYPDWIIDRLTADLGEEAAVAALVAMNQPAVTNVRDDGYVQDPASQKVVTAVAAQPGELVVDLCAAPGGKATGVARSGAHVVAVDVRPNRTRLIGKNVRKLESDVSVVTADGAAPPLRLGSADRVLIDAPCSGLGSLRRRADARWRVDPDTPERLAKLQVDLVLAGLELLRPGGTLTYSVCTLTSAESKGVLDQVKKTCPDIKVQPLDASASAWWETVGEVSRLLPGETDGMTLWQVSTASGGCTN